MAPPFFLFLLCKPFQIKIAYIHYMTKQALRQHYLQQRKALTPNQLAKYNDMLLQQLLKVRLPYLHHVLSYIPLERHNEPDTYNCTKYFAVDNAQVSIAYPKLMPNGTMLAVATTVDTEYAYNAYGILEPVGGMVVAPISIDMVIVPLLICNYKGHRVGYGKGYYDKYLAQCSPHVVKLGLCIHDPIDVIDDIQHYDIPLTHCITPELVYEF